MFPKLIVAPSATVNSIFLLAYPIKDTFTVTVPSFTSNEKFPLKSVEAPLVVPTRITSAPGSGSLELSNTVPVTV